MAFAAIMWRLSQGPMRLSFLAPTIQESMNRNLPGMRVTISDFIVERDRANGQPRFRLRDLALRDLDGNLIARAPRASIGVDGRELLTGTIAANKLELIGANLLVRRKADGTFRLGLEKRRIRRNRIRPLRPMGPRRNLQGRTARVRYLQWLGPNFLISSMNRFCLTMSGRTLYLA